MGYQTIIISNQPGIAKGHYDINEFNKIKQKMERNLFQYNIKLDGQYYCLHHPDAKIFQYRKICECRKPGVKNFVDAVTKHDVDVKKSFFIGDGIADMQLANRVDCRGIFIGNVNSTLLKIFKEKHLNPFYIAHDLLEAATFIKKEIKLIPKPEK
jgi:histidinol-phosphate phosphatase family protein